MGRAALIIPTHINKCGGFVNNAPIVHKIDTFMFCVRVSKTDNIYE